MENRKLPTGNRMLEALNRAEEIEGCHAATGPYGPCMYCVFPNGIHLNCTIDPYIFYGSEVQDPESVESFTFRFEAYTTSDNIHVEFLSQDDIEKMLDAETAVERKIGAVLKELTGIQLEISWDELMEAETALGDRELQEMREEQEQAEKHSESMSLCQY